MRTTDIVDNYIDLPSDFEEGRYVIVDAKTSFQVSIDNYKVAPQQSYFKQIGNRLEFSGTIKDPKVTMIYTARIPALTPTAQTNWLLERFPNAYLHAVLSASYRWLKDPEAEALEEQALQQVAGMIAEDNRRGSAPIGPLREEIILW